MKARHARGRRWGTGPKPMFGSGRVRYEIGARINPMSYGGIGVVRRLVSKLGLAGEINRRLALLKRHLPYHESDHVLNIAYNMLCGGTRLEDLGALRNNAAYMDALGAEVIPSPTAAGDFTRRFGEAGVIELQECINAVRPRLWEGRGRDLLGPVAFIDVDGTLAPTLGEKKDGIDMSYKGVWGYHPLVISLANTGEVLYLVNRPGNAVSHQGAAEWIDKAIGLVAPHAERVCVRGDTDFSLTVNFDRWSEVADFIFGYDAQPGMVKRAEALEEGDWERLERRPRYTSRTGKTRRKRADVKHGVQPRVLTLHSDRGSPMTGKCTAQLLADLGITQSLSRPRISNDNPYSEAQFKTVKYHPGFPGRFGNIEEAKDFCREFFSWYNTQHRHGGIGLLTPEQVHVGRAPEVIRQRQDVLAAAYAARPDRFVAGPPRAAELSAEVWINRPLAVSPVDGAEVPADGDGARKEGSLN